MEHSTFRLLLKKYLSGALEPAEERELSRLLEAPEYRALLEHMLDEALEEEAHAGEPDEEILNSIKYNLQQRIQLQQKTAVRLRMNRWLSVAAMLLLVAGAATFYLRNKPGQQAQAVAPKQPAKPIEPGGNKAVLTLADGSEIILDSTGNGNVTMQGAVKVIKLSDGKLAYQPGAATGAMVYNSIATPRGGQYQLELSDGTKVWLNATSTLKFPVAFSGKERRVILTGEGYFEVAKNATMPFHVEVNGVDINVLGTHFNVNAYANEATIRTTLLEGSVSVAGKGGQCVLRPGQQAVANATDKMEVNNNVDADEVVAWKYGMFRFKGAALATILRQASRWYDIDFVFEAETDEKFSGEIARTVNAEQLLNILELTGKVDFEVKGRTVLVIPK